MMKIKWQTSLTPAFLLSLSLLSGCNSDDNTNSQSVEGVEMAVVAAVGADYSSSSVSIAESSLAEAIVNEYATSDSSDMSVATYGDYFYRVGRGESNISKFSYDNPSLPEWQFSVKADGVAYTNPQDIVFLNEEKAYVIRYGASSILVVNPSVTADEEELFVIGEIDLSGYDADGVPNMKDAVIVDGILYVTMQGMDSSFVPGIAHLAAIDTSTDTELKIGENSLVSGLVLKVKNPNDLEYHNGALYVAGIGRYASTYSGTPAEYTGGIEKIVLSDFSSTLILDDGDDTSHPYGQVTGLEVLSDNALVFSGYAAWQDVSLFQLNLDTLEVSDGNFAGIASQDIRAFAADDNSRLWVGISSDSSPTIKVIDSETETVTAELTMTQNPIQIVFGNRNK